MAAKLKERLSPEQIAHMVPACPLAPARTPTCPPSRLLAYLPITHVCAHHACVCVCMSAPMRACARAFVRLCLCAVRACTCACTSVPTRAGECPPAVEALVYMHLSLPRACSP